jgi:uncharacterized protein (DUF885 family)
LTDDTRDKALDLATRYWEGLLREEPLLGTEVGDERYDDRLQDPSEEGVARRKEFMEGAVAEAAGLDHSALDPDTRITIELLEAISKREIDSIKHRLDRFYAVGHMYGPGQLLADLATLQRADTPERLERYILRLQAVPGYLQARDEVALDAASRGLTVPALVADRTMGQVERLLALTPEESPGVAPVPESDSDGRERVVGVLREAVWPAYAGYLDMLKRYRPQARDTIGLVALPDGEAIYASAILSYTTLPLDARAVHQTGLDQLEKIQEERREIADRLGYPDASSALAAHKASGKNTAVSREDMVRIAEEQVSRSWDAAPAFFGRLPGANCDVKPVEEFRERDMPDAFYFPGSGDGSRRGQYYVNTYDLGKRPLHHLASITYHEANPGHHFQITIEQEFTERHPIRRFGGFLAGSAFTEGWGLYSERLADEMGLYLDDYERLGMLDAQGWRAARLIVDTGIHALGWDRERSIAQMEEAGVARLSAEIETDRYISIPGQALAYMIGQIEISRVRALAEEREGSAFDLRAFHDRVLGLGSVTLPVLQREMGGAG